MLQSKVVCIFFFIPFFWLWLRVYKIHIFGIIDFECDFHSFFFPLLIHKVHHIHEIKSRGFSTFPQTPWPSDLLIPWPPDLTFLTLYWNGFLSISQDSIRFDSIRFDLCAPLVMCGDFWTLPPTNATAMTLMPRPYPCRLPLTASRIENERH